MDHGEKQRKNRRGNPAADDYKPEGNEEKRGEVGRRSGKRHEAARAKRNGQKETAAEDKKVCPKTG